MRTLSVVAVVILLAVVALFRSRPAQEPAAEAEEAVTLEPSPETRTVRAMIRRVKHDMNPVTLRGWTRIVCDCEDGAERTMSFDGETGVYLAAGESGLLEHREGVFVSFTKDSGEVVTGLYRLLPGEQDEGRESI